MENKTARLRHTKTLVVHDAILVTGSRYGFGYGSGSLYLTKCSRELDYTTDKMENYELVRCYPNNELPSVTCKNCLKREMMPPTY